MTDKKEKKRLADRAYYLKNRDKILAQGRAYSLKNKDAIKIKDRIRNKKYRAANKEKERLRQRIWRVLNREKHNARSSSKNRKTPIKVDKKKFPLRYGARKAVDYAIKMKRLIKQPCQICNSKKNVQAHHNSYRKKDWLNITWLCRIHHYAWHRVFKFTE